MARHVGNGSVVVPEESLRHQGSSRTNLQVPVLRLKSLKFSRTLQSAFCRHSVIITSTMRLNRDEEDRELATSHGFR